MTHTNTEAVSDERLAQIAANKSFSAGEIVSIATELISLRTSSSARSKGAERAAIAALVRWEGAPQSDEPHLWGVMYSDNNRVDAHNVYLTKGAALQRAAEAAIAAKVVPLYLGASHP